MALPKTFNFKKIELFFTRWRKSVANKVGSIFNEVATKAKYGGKALISFIRNNPGKTVAGAGAATMVGIGLSQLQSRVETNGVRSSKGEILRRDHIHRHVYREAVNALSSISDDNIESLSDYEVKKLAIEAAISASRIVLGSTSDDVHDYFLMTLLLQTSLMRTGYSLICPDDYQPLVAYIAEALDSEQFAYGIDQSLVPLAISVANNPHIQLEDIA
jgi:hypothetical protein